MEKIILQIYGSIELMGISMTFMGSYLMRHNVKPVFSFFLYGIGWTIVILCPALYLLDKMDNREEKVDEEK